MPITGGDIPPEIFGIILTFLRSPLLRFAREGHGGVHAEKHELSSLSLVSKYWAKMCRPRIFTSITLRSADDVYTLMSLTRSSTSRIADYISILKIPSVTSGEVPWIHLLPLLYPKLSNTQWYLDMTVEGPFATKQGSMRSVHRVPRPIPSFSQNIHTLRLKTVTFRRFSDLVALVEELRQLKKLFCQKLTWPKESATPKLSQKHGHALFDEASMTDCTSNWRILWFTAGFSSLEDPPWSEDDWDAFLPLLRSFETGLPAKCIDRKLRIMDRISPSAQYSGQLDGIEHQTPCITSICNASEDARHRRIECLSIDFVHGLEPESAIALDDAMKCDWQSFDQNLAQLDKLQKIVFGFRSKDDFLTFFEAGVTPQLLRRDRFNVIYATWQLKSGSGLLGGTWQYVSTDSDGEPRDSGIEFLDEL